MQTGQPTTGIVLIGRNEGERLVAGLESLGFHAARAVYVDSGSTDNSIREAASRGVAVVELPQDQPFTAARARNAGFLELVRLYPDTSFVQFLDGDCRLQSDWLGTALDFLAGHEDVAIVSGRLREMHPERSVYNYLCDREWDTPVGEADACGGICLVRRPAFEAVSGFRPQLIAGEEPEMCLRLREKGWKIWRVDADMASHDANMLRFSQWWRRSVRAGYAFTEVTLLHRHSPKRIWKRNVVSALLWGCVLPLLILAGGIVHPAFLALAAIYPLQVARIALRSNDWRRAFFFVLGKFSETQGIFKFAIGKMLGKRQRLIEYK